MGRYLPILTWGREYSFGLLSSDLMAALIVSIMLIPQSLAYAMLAGLPPQVGLYASILPLVAYAVFGTSRTLAVGPVAVLSLLTAAAAGTLAPTGSEQYLAIAVLLAVISGLMLLVLGLLRLGFLTNFLSHPVVSGFISASGLIIAASQLKHILGIDSHGHSQLEIVSSLFANFPATNPATLAIGGVALVFLFWVRSGLKPLLLKTGLRDNPAAMFARAGPVVVVLAGIIVVAQFDLAQLGVRIVGEVPTGLPTLVLPSADWALWTSLFGAAAVISVIGFVESVSVAQTLAAKRRESIDPNQELIGLGAANLSAGLSGGFPVTGGFARSAVNFDAGARTPAASAFTAIGIAVAAIYLTPYLFYLPNAVLAATIIVAVLSLIDIQAIRRTWQYSRSDFAAMAMTILMTLAAGVEVGVSTGVMLSIGLHLYHTSRPHFAIVGRISNSEHYRNKDRHPVIDSDRVLTIRIDESLYFANAKFLEDLIVDEIAQRQSLTDLVLMCTAVNHIDASGLESLEMINDRLAHAGITLHLTELKGPVADRLARTQFFEHLSGNVYLSQYAAMCDLDPASTRDVPPQSS